MIQMRKRHLDFSSDQIHLSQFVWIGRDAKRGEKYLSKAIGAITGQQHSQYTCLHNVQGIHDSTKNIAQWTGVNERSLHIPVDINVQNFANVLEYKISNIVSHENFHYTVVPVSSKLPTHALKSPRRISTSDLIMIPTPSFLLVALSSPGKGRPKCRKV